MVEMYVTDSLFLDAEKISEKVFYEIFNLYAHRQGWYPR